MTAVASAVVPIAVAADGATPLAHWQQVIRQAPYWESQGAHANLATIRRCVLAGESYR